MGSTISLLLVWVLLLCSQAEQRKPAPKLLDQARLPEGMFLARSFSMTRVIVAGFQGVPGPGAVAMYDIERKRLGPIDNQHKGGVWAIDVNPEKNLVATAGGEGEFLLWDTEAMRLLSRHSIGSFKAGGLSFSPDGKHLAVAGPNLATTWATMHVHPQSRIKLDSNDVREMVFIPGSCDLAIVDYDKLVIFDTKINRIKTSWRPTGNRIVAATFLYKSGLLFIADASGCIATYDLATKRQKQAIPLRTTERFIVARCTTDGDMVLAGGNRGGVLVFHPKKGTSYYFQAHSSVVRSVDFLGKDRFITCGDDSKLKIWDRSSFGQAAQ